MLSCKHTYAANSNFNNVYEQRERGDRYCLYLKTKVKQDIMQKKAHNYEHKINIRTT